jgi:hypothetical protein
MSMTPKENKKVLENGETEKKTKEKFAHVHCIGFLGSLRLVEQKVLSTYVHKNIKTRNTGDGDLAQLAAQ